MKRYELEWHGPAYGEVQRMAPDEDGDWVRYEEVEAELAELRGKAASMDRQTGLEGQALKGYYAVGLELIRMDKELERLRRVEEALHLVLPMAKGYQSWFPERSNAALIEQADAALRSALAVRDGGEGEKP